MSEELLAKYTEDIINSIGKDREDLESTVKKAEEKGTALMKLFFKENKYPEFDTPQKMWSGLADLSEQIGHALYMVLEVENKRAGLVKLVEEKGEKTKEKGENPHLITVQTSTQPVVQAPGGLFGYMGQRTQAGATKAIKKMELDYMRQQGPPKIATEQRVLDILEFGRQLIPEFNRIHLYFQQCLDHLHFYDDDELKAFFHGELRTHLSKLTGIIRSFCRTVAEYRKAVLDEVKMALAKGMTEVVVARYIAEGKIPLSELFKEMREAGGPTKF